MAFKTFYFCKARLNAYILKREIMIKENITDMCNLQVYLNTGIGILEMKDVYGKSFYK